MKNRHNTAGAHGKALNGIGNDAIDEMKTFYGEYLSNSTKPTSLFEANFYLGFIAWKEKQDRAMLEHFERASDLAVQIYCQRGEEGKKCSHPEKQIFPMLAVYSFASLDVFNALKSIPNCVFLDEASEHPINRFIAWFKNDIGAPNLTELAAVTDRLQYVYEETAYTKSARAFTHAIEAVLQRNEEQLTLELEALLRIHQEEIEEGALQQRFEGFLCLWATAVQRFARLHNMSCRVSSRWVPSCGFKS